VALVVMGLYLAVSIVLYVCLEAVDDENNRNNASVSYFGIENNLISRVSRMNGSSAERTGIENFRRSGDRQGLGRSVVRSQGSSAARSEFEKLHPPDDMNRIRAAVAALRVPPPETQPDVPYDIYNCPAEGPPKGYPMTWRLSKQILKDWNPKDTEIPSRIYHGLCVFDWDRDQQTAEIYRRADVPFVVQNNPEVMRASERWNAPGYLQRMIGDAPQRTEHSSTSHLMYWKNHPRDNPPPGWKPPSDNVEMTIDQFLERAAEMERHKDDQLHREHWYFRLNGSYRGKNSYLYEELPIFVAGDKPSFYMVDPAEARGINCRLGMRGNIAETHYDSSLNWIVVMGGQRRYILAHPIQCKNMELYHFGHPSARHSSVDWTNPPDDDERPFSSAMATEVVLQPGADFFLFLRAGVMNDPDSALSFLCR
jgi:Cupin-like domain